MDTVVQRRKDNFAMKNHLHTILLLILIAISIIIFVLVAVILGIISHKKYNDNMNIITTTSTSAVVKHLWDTINSTQLMFHLKKLQEIADNNGRTRALGTSGFKATVDYIETQLKSKTNFHIFKEEFAVPVSIRREPVLTSTIAGVDKNYIYETDFRMIFSSAPADFLTPIRLTIIPNSGCQDEDWQRATPYSANGSIAIVVHDQNCSVEQKSIVAQKYNINGLLLYNNTNTTRLPIVFAAENITYIAMAVSYEVGSQLSEAVQNHVSTNPHVRMFMIPGNTLRVNISSENLCADIPTGNRTQTIVIGSHSDSIENGSGINDNGSGAMATLVLALNMANLLQTSFYEKYMYRIRFCWWGAEERNMYGSFHHVEQANITTVEGNRLKDYLMMLNFDMLASPNYYFGIHQGNGLPDIVSSKVINGSERIAQIFRNWFDQENLPWDNSSLGLLSDHVPFLVSGIPSGGLFTGADGHKTLEQRDRYDRMLGHGYGGIAKASFDPCYHETCDTIENTNPFAFETMVKAAAYTIETFARMSNLYQYLYE
ncbi:unnamed protein product [Adineta steineri]|uniref:Peptide hydrolase n=1 Tax=Adineta steineri TaxID=433720 RepID=A0A814JN55_9BILA|nr:unnamed protein product [Adineta steineri]CAF1102689.1 unnamed protein product [Adineta steineri]